MKDYRNRCVLIVSGPDKYSFKKVIFTIMKYKHLGIGAIALSIVAGTALAAPTFAQSGNSLDRPDKEAVHQAVVEGNYDTWKALVGENSKFAERMTEDRFERMSQHVNERIDQGLPVKKSLRKKVREHKAHRFMENNPDIISAIESKDFVAWSEAVGDRPVSEKITADNFDQFIEMIELKKSGDHEGAREIAQELDLKKPKGFEGKHKAELEA